MLGLILYGPPASGKDTITTELVRLNGAYSLFERLKVGDGRTHGYRMIDGSKLDAMRREGEVIWENTRYRATYAIDRTALTDHLRHHLAIVHLGQPEAIFAVRSAIPTAQWFVVSLWCPKETARQRATLRRTGDVEARMQAWAETAPLSNADLYLDTSLISPEDAARLIDEQARGKCA